MRTIVILLIAVCVAGCSDPGSTAGVEGAWQLGSGTVDGTEIPILDDHPITLTLTDGMATGTASCNGYGGEYELSGSKLTFGDLAMTEMACQPEESMIAEQLYGSALSLVEDSLIDERGLLLTGPGVELQFEALDPVPDEELTGVVWVLDGLITGDAVSSVRGDQATLELTPDGSLQGGTGCRLLSGTYVISGAEVHLTEFAADGSCVSDLAEQDSRVVSVLEGGFRVEIDGNSLRLTSTGNEGLVYRAQS